VVALQRRPGKPPRRGLEHEVAPQLGALDLGAPLGIGREERRLGHQRVERP